MSRPHNKFETDYLAFWRISLYVAMLKCLKSFIQFKIRIGRKVANRDRDLLFKSSHLQLSSFGKVRTNQRIVHYNLINT